MMNNSTKGDDRVLTAEWQQALLRFVGDWGLEVVLDADGDKLIVGFDCGGVVPSTVLEWLPGDFSHVGNDSNEAEDLETWASDAERAIATFSRSQEAPSRHATVWLYAAVAPYREALERHLEIHRSAPRYPQW